MELYGSIICGMSILTLIISFIKIAVEDFNEIYVYNIVANMITLIVGVIMLTK